MGNKEYREVLRAGLIETFGPKEYREVLRMVRKMDKMYPPQSGTVNIPDIHAVLTERSREVFKEYAKDACNWSGTPLIGGNVGGSKEERGNLTQLKIAGLIETFGTDDGCDWVRFTEEGEAYALKELGIDILLGTI